MARHWTYGDTPCGEVDLLQGDILYPTDDILRVLRPATPQPCYHESLGFLVVSQCCDLVRRAGHPCKANHIAIVEVRELESILQDLFESVCTKVCAGVFIQESKVEAQQLLRRILNQNEQALGLFYLHPCEEGTGFLTVESVALLRAAISLPRSHYQVLLEARRGRLDPQFRNKLGWLVGNLYSRVGTPDWSEQADGEELQSSMVRKHVDSENFTWVKNSSVNLARGGGVQFDNLTKAEAIAQLERFQAESLKYRVVSETQSQLRKLLEDLPKSIAGPTSSKVLDALPQAQPTISTADIRSIIERQLCIIMKNLPDDIAERTTNALAIELGIDDLALNTLKQRFQRDLSVLITETLERIPDKLSSRLTNRPVLGEVGKLEDSNH